MGTTTLWVIIVVLLAVLYAGCVSYIMRKRIQPWTGGIFLILDSGGLLPFKNPDRRWIYDSATIPQENTVVGLHFSGADAMRMPYVECYFFVEAKNRESSRRKNLFTRMEMPSNGGVNVLFSYPLSSKHPKVYCLIMSQQKFSCSDDANSYFYRNLEISGK